MSYLSDKEKRILFAALDREEKVCKKMDKKNKGQTDKQPLLSIVWSLKRKFYYDRFEEEIRTKSIDKFADKMIVMLPGHKDDILAIAKQMKGEF